MNRKNISLILIAVLLVAVCAFGATSAQAVLIEFEGVAPLPPPDDDGIEIVNNEHVESGFTLANPSSSLAAIVNSDLTNNGAVSDYYVFITVNDPIRLTNDSGLPFNLSFLKVGALDRIDATFNITGNFSNGLMDTETVLNVGAFIDFDLNWTDLTSVEFRWVSGSMMGFGAIDDLDVTPGVAPIPEPTTMLLLGSGLIGLAGFRRKFKKI